jgi:hypothetical protein
VLGEAAEDHRVDRCEIGPVVDPDRAHVWAARGMTKPGVALAIGDPPEHATPNLEANTWLYWKSRFDILIVHFEAGKVVRIED